MTSKTDPGHPETTRCDTAPSMATTKSDCRPNTLSVLDLVHAIIDGGKEPLANGNNLSQTEDDSPTLSFTLSAGKSTSPLASIAVNLNTQHPRTLSFKLRTSVVVISLTSLGNANHLPQLEDTAKVVELDFVNAIIDGGKEQLAIGNHVFHVEDVNRL